MHITFFGAYHTAIPIATDFPWRTVAFTQYLPTAFPNTVLQKNALSVEQPRPPLACGW
jgi:hypothetical protein